MNNPQLYGRGDFIRFESEVALLLSWWIASKTHIVLWRKTIFVSDLSASTVRYRQTVAMTGNGELGFDSGEGAWEMATTSKEGSRRANYPILEKGGSDKK